MTRKSIRQSPRRVRSWTTAQVVVGTRVVLLRTVPRGEPKAGVIRDIRIASYLKRFVILGDDASLHYASESELALETDPLLAPLGPSLHDE